MHGKRKEDKQAKKNKEAKKPRVNNNSFPDSLPVMWRGLSTVFVFGLGYALSTSGAFYSQSEGRMSIWPRLLFLFVAQASMSDLLMMLLLQVGRRFVGERHATSWAPSADEVANNDNKILWPASDLLSAELRQFSAKHGQPFCLNHVTGRRRCKDAFMRLGMNLGSFVTVWCMCRWMDNRTLASIGLTLDQPFYSEAVTGFFVGAVIVFFMLVVELSAGWVRFLRFFEVFDKSESFLGCIFWDIIFHLNVAFNEELPVRGWMLCNLADASVVYFGFAQRSAYIVAMLCQSAFFVMMHLQSPGGTTFQSMLGIFTGGMAGGLNVLLTHGRLGFALGWHFGWNIFMGNVFGLSTSGIPISATFISVAPHPEKKHLHGGVFGPEGGVVAPAAYTLGVVLLVCIYGLPDGKAEMAFSMAKRANLTNA